MSYPERQTIREVRYVGTLSWCCSSVLWGVALVLIGVVGLLPDDLARYGWPIVAIAGGAWLIFGPLDRRREEPRGPFDDSSPIT